MRPNLLSKYLKSTIREKVKLGASVGEADPDNRNNSKLFLSVGSDVFKTSMEKMKKRSSSVTLGGALPGSTLSG